MTLVLAIETATPRCSVALGHEGGLLASFSVDRDRRHVEALVPAISSICHAAGVALADLDAVAVDTGPGLFTGMRVGIATAQALALALDLPVHPVCSLDVLAYPLRHAGQPVAAVVDARRGEVFRSLHQVGVELAGPACVSPATLAGELVELGGGLATGDGAVRHRSVLEAAGAQIAAASPAALTPGPGDGGATRPPITAGGPSVIEVVAAMPTAESALELALARIAADVAGLDAALVQARYLRTPDARANFAVAAGGVA